MSIEEEPGPRRRWLFGVIGAAVAILAAVAGYAWLSGGHAGGGGAAVEKVVAPEAPAAVPAATGEKPSRLPPP